MIFLASFRAFLGLLFLTATSGVKLPLVDMNNLPPSPDSNYRSHFEARMKRDAVRVATLTGTAAYNVTDLGTDVGSIGNGYVVTIGVGSPPMDKTMLIDTGSDIVWLPCQPCNECQLSPNHPIFDPLNSTSFSYPTCDSLQCLRVNEKTEKRGCDSGRCTYEVRYGDGSNAEGVLALESITVGATKIPNVPIGCAHSMSVTVNADGVLALGRGSLSFASQSGGLIGGAFTYCLPWLDEGEGGWLKFGRSDFPRDATWLQVITNPKIMPLYYVELSGLAVNDEPVDIPEDTFQLDIETGEGGAIFDSGTMITRLPRTAYTALRDKFKDEMPDSIPTVPGVSIMDTCFTLENGTDGTTNIPNVSLMFSKETAIMNLNARNVLVRMMDVFCFAFAPFDDQNGITIIGNTQQQGIQISVDATIGNIGFGPNCL